VLPLELVIAKGEKHAVCISRLAIYATGFTFELVTLAATFDAIDPMLFGPHARRGRHPGVQEQLDPQQLRFGVQFSDGRRATNVEGYRHDAGPPGSGIALHHGGGGSGGRAWHQDMWVWPLPPPGPVTFVCEWPAAGIELTRHELDSALLREAAERAQVIWPEDDGSGTPASRGSTTQIAVATGGTRRHEEPPPPPPPLVA
jgi:hypothetical protein